MVYNEEKGKITKILNDYGYFILFVSYVFCTIKGAHWVSW
jgi:hypothetical protein